MKEKSSEKKILTFPKNLSKDTTDRLVAEMPHVEVHVFSFSAVDALHSSEKRLKWGLQCLWALKEFTSWFQVTNADLWTLEFLLGWE